MNAHRDIHEFNRRVRFWLSVIGSGAGFGALFFIIYGLVSLAALLPGTS